MPLDFRGRRPKSVPPTLHYSHYTIIAGPDHDTYTYTDNRLLRFDVNMLLATTGRTRQPRLLPHAIRPWWFDAHVRRAALLTAAVKASAATTTISTRARGPATIILVFLHYRTRGRPTPRRREYRSPAALLHRRRPRKVLGTTTAKRETRRLCSLPPHYKTAFLFIRYLYAPV